MTRGLSTAAGRYLRANNSLAPSLGSLGLASGGSGFGLTVPLSCANAGTVQAARPINRENRKRRGVIRIALSSNRNLESREGDRHSGRIVRFPPIVMFAAAAS